MTPDELIQLVGTEKVELLKKIKEHDFFLNSGIVREVQECLNEIAENPGTVRLQVWPPETGWQSNGWKNRREENRIYFNGQPAYWIQISHDNGSIYDAYEPVAWMDLEPGEEVWIDNVAANPQAAVPVTGPWIVVHYHKLFSIANNNTVSYQADNLVRKR
jgi:hypothetical protein